MQSNPLRLTTEDVVDDRLSETSIVGGVAEIDETAVAVAPARRLFSQVVMIATVDTCRRRHVLNRSVDAFFKSFMSVLICKQAFVLCNNLYEIPYSSTELEIKKQKYSAIKKN